jgi:hypothetical protein
VGPTRSPVKRITYRTLHVYTYGCQQVYVKLSTAILAVLCHQLTGAILLPFHVFLSNFSPFLSLAASVCVCQAHIGADKKHCLFVVDKVQIITFHMTKPLGGFCKRVKMLDGTCTVNKNRCRKL